MIVHVASWVLLMAGAFFVLTGGIGLVRMPDFFTRLHPAGMTDTLGAGLMLTGLMLQSGATFVTLKLVLILLFLLFTSPTSSFSLAHAALLAGEKPWTRARGTRASEDAGDEGGES